ncbi:MAG: NADH-quinone oxidoreductase subunit A [Ignavibacteriales bacterium]|nr:NADH-quinone oxidoreductase subunit A [Ignavibacteriaceae bacterium]QOJ29583.1 MAG: NADH-quinone oxidoreductase subunit A [Ignavibacteriales bacterium]
MIETYIPLFLVFGFAIVFAVGTVMSSGLFGPQRPNEEKLSTYESGMKPVGTAFERVSVKYYLVAMLFIIFDLEVIFVYPWAVQFKSLYNDPAVGTTAFYSMLLFLIVFEIGFLYVYKKGGFKWD